MDINHIKIAGKYVIGPKIGSGSFGDIYLVNLLGTSDIFALKKESDDIKHCQLNNEAKILRIMSGTVGYPQIYWEGTQLKCNLMVISLLGPTLEDLFVMCDRKFSLKTTLMLATQLITRLEAIHSKNYIHRDIKPENFLMGLTNKSHLVHLIDFGLSKKFRDPETRQHIPYKQNKNLSGTARYVSIYAHLGIQQSRRDDLEALGYMLLYFVQGHLPWQGIKANNKLEKFQQIFERKMTLAVEMMSSGLPIEFSIYLKYCRAIKFEDKPDYNFLQNLFLELMGRKGYIYDYDYDWCKLKCSKKYENDKIKVQIKNNENKIQEIGEKVQIDDILLDYEQENIDEACINSELGFLKQTKGLTSEGKKNKLLYK